jgi:hypothetical protein
MWRYGVRALLFDDVDIASGKDTLKPRSLVPASPPCRESIVSIDLVELVERIK